MLTILKAANFEYTHTVQVGAGQATSAPRPDSPAHSSPPLEPDGVVVVPPPEPEEDLAEAQQQVEMMLNQARSQVVVWQQEAQEAGWQVGYDEAKQAALNGLSETLATARRVAQSAVESRAQFLHQSQGEFGRLALAIAAKIIGHELATTPGTIADIVTNVIETACVREACIIRVNPEDYEMLRTHWSGVAAGQTPDKAWDLVADRRIGRGGCLIEANGGSIDAQLETQLRQVELVFDAVHQSHGATVA